MAPQQIIHKMLSTARLLPHLPTGLCLRQRRLPHPVSCANPKPRVPPPISGSLPSDRDDTDDGKTNAASTLRGSDILLAMQRAAAKKESGGVGAQNAVRKGKKRRGSRTSTDENEPLLPADYDVDSVRPIEVKDDWAPRIDELECRLQDLRSRYHY